MEKKIYILAIESSCDDTSASVLCNNKVLSNIIASQKVHEKYGGVVPELASRAHQQNIVPVVHAALNEARVKKESLDVVAFTGGPGLTGSLLVGISFAKAFALALNKPCIEVDHLDAHIFAHFIEGQHDNLPQYPFLCLTVSGGHTQIAKVNSPFNIEIIGKTIDDAAGEAFDKAAKIMGLTYPGGPVIDKLAKKGDKKKIPFPQPKIPGLNFSFSGLKTSFLYNIRDNLALNCNYIEENKANLAASIQHAIVEALIKKLIKASNKTGIKHIAVSGGVSANSELREQITKTGKEYGWSVYIPEIKYTTDNAAMIGVVAWLKYQKGLFAGLDAVPYANAL